MGKAELKNVPLFNIFFRRMNIAVNRSSITSAHKAYQRARTDLSKGISITIFPEATIPECAPELGPFKNGAFKLAVEQQVSVVPITFLDNWKLFPDNKRERFVVRPGFSRIIVHKPISTSGMTDADISGLRQQVYEIIRDTMKKHGRMPCFSNKEE